jgi:hypothetical protein
MAHSGSKTRGAWRAHVGVGEEVILTRHQKGKASEEEIADGKRFYIEELKDTLVFKDRETGDQFESPSGLCRARLAPRQGKKGTNDWNGPMHCLVRRAGAWVTLSSLDDGASICASICASSRSSTPPPAAAGAADGGEKKPAAKAKPRVSATAAASAMAAAPSAPKTLEEENAALRAELAATKTALARAQAALAAALRV